MDKNIFVTYNPGIEAEELLAVRLHTIGAVNGFTMYLPDRYNSAKEVGQNTLHFIKQSGWLVFFSFGNLSSTVTQEINAAFRHLKDKSRIIVVYHKQVGKNLGGGEADKFTSIYYDPAHESMDEALQKILKTLNEKRRKADNNGFLALLGIGLGLFALATLTQEEEKPKKPKKSPKTQTAKVK